jgi:hypothetical protein
VFDDLGYKTRIEHVIIEISLDEKLVDRGTKECGLYLLVGFTIIGHASLANGGSLNDG